MQFVDKSQFNEHSNWLKFMILPYMYTAHVQPVPVTSYLEKVLFQAPCEQEQRLSALPRQNSCQGFCSVPVSRLESEETGSAATPVCVCVCVCVCGCVGVCKYGYVHAK